jgi:hypothetical protein
VQHDDAESPIHSKEDDDNSVRDKRGRGWGTLTGTRDSHRAVDNCIHPDPDQ